jgi:hypothetical protein
MPPKIREMTANSISSPSAQNALRRFTLMLPGEDVFDSEGEPAMGDRPIQGLPHECFLLGDLVPLAPVLLLGQTSQVVNPSEIIACLQPVHLHATRDHLILMGQNQIDLTQTESTELLKTALPFIEEDFPEKKNSKNIIMIVDHIRLSKLIQYCFEALDEILTKPEKGVDNKKRDNKEWYNDVMYNRYIPNSLALHILRFFPYWSTKST